MASYTTYALLIAAVLAAAMVSSSEAQSTTPSCASKLVPCAEYMNSTNPPASCCDPIKEAVATQRDCLCNLYNTPGLLESFGINVTQALALTRACGVDADTSLCPVTAPSPTSVPPPGVPGNDAGKIASLIGIPSLVLLWASSILLY